MKSSLLLILLVVVMSFAMGCKSPDQNRQDATSRMEKKAGGADE
ncbi:MAG TPA: hypothetical protein VKT78_16170 [Fimbriimonadaceae bacterium]|nr:hypothetical protein [Fimbriimonadaceae bacterium]